MQWKTAITTIENDHEYIRGYALDELIRSNSFVETIFLILKGTLPSKAEARMLDALFTAEIDHGVGVASAMAARLSASTGNSLHTSVAAGILSFGMYHGNAIEGAAQFFQENCSTQDLAGLLKSLKEQKKRVMGFGHRFLAHDSRVDALFAIAKELGVYGAHCAFAEQTGEELNKISSKKLPMNIDGAAAAIISDLGFDWRMAQGFFIIGRVPGLVAQVVEEMKSGEGLRRLEKDEIEYTGVAPGSNT